MWQGEVMCSNLPTLSQGKVSLYLLLVLKQIQFCTRQPARNACVYSFASQQGILQQYRAGFYFFRLIYIFNPPNLVDS